VPQPSLSADLPACRPRRTLQSLLRRRTRHSDRRFAPLRQPRASRAQPASAPPRLSPLPPEQPAREAVQLPRDEQRSALPELRRRLPVWIPLRPPSPEGEQPQPALPAAWPKWLAEIRQCEAPAVAGEQSCAARALLPAAALPERAARQRVSQVPAESQQQCWRREREVPPDDVRGMPRLRRCGSELPLERRRAW